MSVWIYVAYLVGYVAGIGTIAVIALCKAAKIGDKQVEDVISFVQLQKKYIDLVRENLALYARIEQQERLYNEKVINHDI